MQVNILEAKNRLSELIKTVQAGAEVVIANRGEPVARLVAVNRKSSETGTAAAILGWLEQHRLPPYARRSDSDIDAGVTAERGSWD